MAETLTVGAFSKGLQAQFKTLQRPVSALAESFGVMRQKVAKIAPDVRKLFKAMENEAAQKEIAFSFVAFVRLFDPQLPSHADEKNGEPGYKGRRSYQALDYVRRIWQAADRPKGQRGARDLAVDQVARLIRQVMEFIKSEDHAEVWNIIDREFRITASAEDSERGQRRLANLKGRVQKVEPLFSVRESMKPIHITAAQVVHMPSTKDQTPSQQLATLKAAQEAVSRRGALAKPGRRVHKAA